MLMAPSEFVGTMDLWAFPHDHFGNTQARKPQQSSLNLPRQFSWRGEGPWTERRVWIPSAWELCKRALWGRSRRGTPPYYTNEHKKVSFAAAAAAKSLQSCPTLCDPIDRQLTRLPCPWDSPGKNTGVGYHFPLQCMKIKSESEVAQSCLTRSDPMDCSLPGSSLHGIFQARVLEWGVIAFSSRLPRFSSWAGN